MVDCEYVENVLEKLRCRLRVESGELVRALQLVTLLIRRKEYYDTCLSMICYAANYASKDVLVMQILYDCIIMSRVFLYVDMLQKSSVFRFKESIADCLAEGFYTLESGTVLTKDQFLVLEEFEKYKRVVVSAPTSFGKTRVMLEIITKYNFNNIAVVVPTIALLNEIFSSLKNNELLSEYKLIINSRQLVGGGKHIFVCTPERMEVVLATNPELRFDFFVMDEIYKIDDKHSSRTDVFMHVLYRMVSLSNCFYLIGPYFKEFSRNFLRRTNAQFLLFETNIVQKETIDAYGLPRLESLEIDGMRVVVFKKKERNLIAFLEQLVGQSLVYVSKKQRAEIIARLICKSRSDAEISDNLLEFVNYLKAVYDDEWSLVQCMRSGVAFHHSGMPRFLLNEIVDLFNSGDVSIIVCTSTLTEGVNTSAKNVLILDSTKGSAPLSGFDVKNIKGRAGRFGKHFVGRTVVLDAVAEESSIDRVDFGLLDDDRLSKDDAIYVDECDLSASSIKVVNDLKKIAGALGVPLEVLKENKYVKVDRQLSLIQRLRSDVGLEKRIYFDGCLPDKESLDLIIDLIFEYLFNDDERTHKTFTNAKIKQFVSYYIYYNPNIKKMIGGAPGKKIDTKIRFVFTLINKYFEFLLPKFLSAFSNLFRFVYSRELNVSYIVAKLQFGFAEDHSIALRELGVPVQIVDKISKYFEGCETIDDIYVRYNAKKFIFAELSAIEYKILKKYL